MRFAILANAGSWYGSDLTRAAQARGHSAALIDFRTLTARIGSGGGRLSGSDHEGRLHDLDKVDAVIVRTMPPGSLEEVVTRMDMLGRLESRGVAVMNSPRAIECAVDKYLTTARLAESGVRVPRTAVCESADQAMSLFTELGGDVVLKPLFGAEGRGIVRLCDPETAFRVFKSLRLTGAVLYLQQFVRHGGFDVRLLVLDGRVIAVMKRVSELDFRTNVSQHADAVRHDATDEEQELAIRSAAITGARIAGVDIIRDPEDRAFVLEVNAVPGWRALCRVSGVDVADAVIRSLEQEQGQL